MASFDPMRYGAKGDGVAKDTEALQKAADACAAAGGGTLLLGPGRYLSGTLRLGGNTVLRIEKGATLLGSQDRADYPVLDPGSRNSELKNCRRALIYAEAADDVRIEGGGSIDGNGDNGLWRGMTLPEGERPMAIFTARCRRVAIDGVTVRDAGAWAVVNLEVEHLVIRGITVDSDLGPTHDGIDVVDGRDVLIEDCTLTCGDDAICLKSGHAMGLSGVVVRHCRILGAGVANGLKIGTASVGPIRDVLFEDIVIGNAQAAAMAVESVDGSAISGIRFRRITVSDVGTPFFILLGARGKAAAGSIRGISFETIRAGALRYPWGSLLSGAPAGHDLQDIVFRDLDVTFKGGEAPAPHGFLSGPEERERFPEYRGGYPDPKFLFATPAAKAEVTAYTLPGWAFFIRHARGVRFEDCRLTLAGADRRAPVATWEASVTGSGLSGMGLL